MKIIENIKRNKKYCLISLFVSSCIVLWCQRTIIFASTGIGNRTVEFFFTVCMITALTVIFNYLFVLECETIQKKNFACYYLKLWAVQTISFLPMYSQNFMYGDDIWGFVSDFNGVITSGIYANRPFANFLNGMLPSVTVHSLQSVRMYAGFTLLLFGLVLFRFLAEQLKDLKLAFCFAAFVVAGCTAVDCIAYASIFPINITLLLSAASFVVYMYARENSGYEKIALVFVSGICLFSAFCIYPIGTPIVFMMYLVTEKQKDIDEKKRLLKSVLYMVYYGLTAFSYLFMAKIFQLLAGIEVSGGSARGQIILSTDEWLRKAEWFFTTVIPQSVTKLVGNLFGSALFYENNMFYGCTYTKYNFGLLITTGLLCLIVFSIIATAWKQKSGVYLFLAVMAIPLSFWPFLVLPESTFLTYYAICTIILFSWYVWDGISVLVSFWRNISKRNYASNLKGIVTAIVVCLIVLQGNCYAENAWVNYSRDSYEYLANTISAELSEREGIDTIIVQGSISPYVGGRDYVIFYVTNVLTELGYDPAQYKIIQTDNKYYLANFSDNEVKSMEMVLGSSKMERLLQYYIHDTMYNRWYYSGTADNQETLEFLRECFISTGQLAEKTDRTISISMDGFNIRNKF